MRSCQNIFSDSWVGVTHLLSTHQCDAHNEENSPIAVVVCFISSTSGMVGLEAVSISCLISQCVVASWSILIWGWRCWHAALAAAAAAICPAEWKSGTLKSSGVLHGIACCLIHCTTKWNHSAVNMQEKGFASLLSMDQAVLDKSKHPQHTKLLVLTLNLCQSSHHSRIAIVTTKSMPTNFLTKSFTPTVLAWNKELLHNALDKLCLLLVTQNKLTLQKS